MSGAKRTGLIAGLAIFFGMLALPVPEGLEGPAWGTAAMGVLMAIWWLTEAVPIAATALVPIVVVPLIGAGSVGEAAAPYANPIIFLFLGGFLLALSMERWGLHRRIALGVLRRSGTGPRRLVGGFMVATAFLSMWVANTAIALMMLPIATSVARVAGEGESARTAGSFQVALMLGIAYAANVGGMATLIGTAPNALMAAYLSEAHGIELGFSEWMLLGVPVVVLALPLVYLVLTRIAFRLPASDDGIAGDLIEAEFASLGPFTPAERKVAAIFLLAATLWVTRPLLTGWLPGLSDAGIAIACGLLLFLLPGDRGGEAANVPVAPDSPTDGAAPRPRVLDWEWAERLPWGVLILFGGGLSLAATIDRTGLNEWIGQAATGLGSWPVVVFVLAVTLFVVWLTELTSNTATTAAFLPILGAASGPLGLDPRFLVMSAVLAASCAFMLPIATPPNAVVYSSGYVRMSQMARAGVWLNLMMTLLITAVIVWLMPVIFGL